MVAMSLSDMRWTSQGIINNNVLNTTLFKHAPLKSNRIKRKCCTVKKSKRQHLKK